MKLVKRYHDKNGNTYGRSEFFTFYLTFLRFRSWFLVFFVTFVVVRIIGNVGGPTLSLFRRLRMKRNRIIIGEYMMMMITNGFGLFFEEID
jgi:hypothetical protein